MILNSGVLADKKLMILYLLSKMDIPLTKTQITNAILENNLIDFFTFQQCISELEEAGMIQQLLYQKKQCFATTESGIKAVEVFDQRISKNTSGIINSYIAKNKDSLKKESQVIAEYSKIGDKEYIVSLKVIERELVLMDLKLSVVSAKQAKQVCEKWKSSSEKIYSQLISSLIN
jgi:predicted transcriptional regulator